MHHPLQHARVEGPIRYVLNGTPQELPRGPCLLERIDNQHVDVIWGERGEHSAEVDVSEVRRAADRGHLMLIN